MPAKRIVHKLELGVAVVLQRLGWKPQNNPTLATRLIPGKWTITSNTTTLNTQTPFKDSSFTPLQGGL